MAKSKLGLRDLIYQLKRELLERDKNDPVPAFYVEGVELELTVAVEGKGGAGVNVYVVDLDSHIRKENTQTVKVKLQSLFTREEVLEMLKKDPDLASKLPQVAKQVLVKRMEG
jgi:hypothetical protein